MNKLFSWKALRILILLIILLIVWNRTQLQKTLTTSWNTPLDVVIYPINADKAEKSSSHIDFLQDMHIKPLQDFFSRQAKDHSLWTDKPINFRINKTLLETPPLPPVQGSFLQNMVWSIKFRWWSNKHKSSDDHLTQVRLYVLFHNPKDYQQLPHSAGLQKGLIGIVYAFADRNYNTQNNIIIAHELLHTLGATDKYDLQTGQPLYPHGYAEPNKVPLLPQSKTEIMGGHRPLTDTTSKMPEYLSRIIIGELTAREIGWLENKN